MSILTWAVVAPRTTSTPLPPKTFRALSSILALREGRMRASYGSPRRGARDLGHCSFGLLPCATARRFCRPPPARRRGGGVGRPRLPELAPRRGRDLRAVSVARLTTRVGAGYVRARSPVSREDR